MTREQELALLIEEQAKDDAAKTVWPEMNGDIYAGSLNHETSEGATYADSLGVVVDFETGEEEVVSFLTRRRGDVLGFASRLEHGTPFAYGRGCRCDRCKAANAAYHLDWHNRKKAKGPWHGTIGGYTNHHCRCYECRRAWRGYRRRYHRLHEAKGYEPGVCANEPCGRKFKPKNLKQRYCSRRCRRADWIRQKRAA